MIAGTVTDDREAVVRVEVQGVGVPSQRVEAVLDTGFTEFIALPPEEIASLGLPWVGMQRMILADGSVRAVAVHDAVVRWHGARVAVQVIETGGGALVGMALLQGSRVTLDVVVDGAVTIEPLGEGRALPE